MSIEWKCENARRRDLEQERVNPPTEYIGHKLLPLEAKTQQSGTVYFVTVTGGTTAQSGRDQQGGSVNKAYISGGTATYAASERIGRYAIPAIEVGNAGGVEKADVIGGKAAKRSVMAAVEDAQAIALRGGTAGVYAYGSYGDLFAAADTALDAIKLYAGRTALVVSTTTFRNIMRLPEVKERLAFTNVTIFDDLVSTRSRDAEALRSCLRGVFGVDDIYIGDDRFWNAGALEGVAIVCKVPSEEEMSYKLDAELGKTFAYMTDSASPEGELPIVIESWPNESLREDTYDGVAYVDVKLLNPGARAVITGIDTAAAAAKAGIPVQVAGGTVVTLDGGTVGA